MAPAPLISVITPTHNRRGEVIRAIGSVLAQTLGRFEYIVVDDGSTDGTAAAIAGIRDPRLIYVRQERRGANAARNAGIEKARAPIVTFLDSDDVYLPKRLERTVALFRANPTLDLVISSFITVKNGKATDSVNRESFLDGAALEQALVAQTIMIAGSAITARRAALMEIGCFDGEISRLQDRELLLRFARRNGAQLSQVIDWRKNSSEDSISGRHEGYVEAYGDLILKHPNIVARYPDLVPYTIARRILADATSGRIALAMAGYRFNRSSKALGYSLLQLVNGYVRGRRMRHGIRRENRAAFGAPPAGDSHGHGCFDHGKCHPKPAAVALYLSSSGKYGSE